MFSLERFFETIADREDPEYAETIRWCGGYFDSEWFDLSIADKDLHNALRSNANYASINRSRKPFRRNKLAMVKLKALKGCEPTTLVTEVLHLKLLNTWL